MNATNLAIKEDDTSLSHGKHIMHLVIERSALIKALSHVQSVVERRGTIPVLGNIKLDAKGPQVTFTGTDMDIALTEHAVCDTKAAGATTVPAHTFYDIVRKLPEGAEVDISTKDSGRVVIKCGQSKFNLASLPVDEFPTMSEGDFTHSFSIASAECKALLDKPAYAMSTEETRYYLNGIYLHSTISEGAEVLRAVATDGHRLARVEVGLPAGAKGMPGIIIPRKTIHELRKIIEGGDGDVKLSLSESKIRFSYGNAVLVSKLIDGNFPDYDRVIPSGNDKVMEVECKAFSTAVDRVSIITSERSRAVKLSLDANKLTLTATSAEQGTATEEIKVSYSSDVIEIGFNSRYMLDMMAQIEGDTVQFVLNDAASPVLVRDTADAGALYVIMPMRV
jgi:DNA polymerase-3 subunit beta